MIHRAVIDIVWQITLAQREESSLGIEPPIAFEWRGVRITDPFRDETGRFPVDPENYYDEAFINSEFVAIANRNLRGE